jgi:molecular chaperone GrpE
VAEEEKESPSGATEGPGDAGDKTAELDVDSLKKALEEEREKADRYLANWQRAEADLVNYKRRSEQDRAELATYANSTLILNMLPVMDDLERALESVPPELADEPWVDGIRLIYRKLRSVLEAEGLTVIECEGQDFDPNLHEAVMCVEGEEGKVVEEIQKGYKFCDRVLRPTMVKVGQEGKD